MTVTDAGSLVPEKYKTYGMLSGDCYIVFV